MGVAGHGPDVLLDRNHELALVDAALESTVERAGSVLLLEGPAGIGKSALCAETVRRARRRDIAVLAACGIVLEADRPWGIVRQLLGAGAPVTASRPDDVAAVRHALGELLSGLVEDRPLLIVVDDAHWADTESLALLEHDDSGAGLVLAARTVDAAADPLHRLAARSRTAHRRIPPLGPDAVAALVRLHAPSHGRSSEELRAATGGNAFLATELARTLAHTPASEVGDLRPERIRRWIHARSSECGDDAGDVAAAVAVLGPDAHLAIVAELAGLSRARVAAAFDALVVADLLLPGPVLSFRHSIVREFVLDLLGEGEREIIHLDAARVLAKTDREPLAIVAHLLQTGPTTETWAINVARAAAGAAMAAASPATAARILRWSLQGPLDVSTRIELLVDLARAEIAAGDTGAFRHLQRALELSPAGAVDPGVHASVGEALYAAGRFDEAVDAFEQGLHISARRDVDPLLEARLLVGLDTAGLLLGRHLEPARSRVAAIAADPPAEPSLAEQILLAMAAAEPALGVDRPRAEVAGLMELAMRDLPADAVGRAILEPILGSLAIFDEYERARGLLDALIGLTVERGERIAYASLRAVRSFCMLGLGRLADADADADDVLRLSADAPTASVHALGPARFSLAVSRLCRGDLQGASIAVDDDGPTPPPGSPMGGWVDVAAGWVALEAGDPDRAVERFGRAGQAFTAAGGSGMVCEWRSGLALANAGLGHSERARQLATEEVTLARTLGSPRMVSRALRTAAAIETEPGRSVELLADAVTVLEGSDAVLARAWTHVEHGAALRRCSRRRAARTALRAGLDLARATGAGALERFAVDELRAAGARAVELAGTGPDALTASERRIAELVASGRSNAEVARALFLSRKTVESHLTRAYRKLGISGRDQLVGHLDPRRVDIH